MKRALMVLVAMAGCGSGEGLEGTWATDGETSHLLLDGGRYGRVDHDFSTGTPSCREAGAYHVVGVEVALSADAGPGCAGRSLLWKASDELWLRSDAASPPFVAVYRRH